ncbi:MAG: fasciclin domain-containing protein [Chromatiaceae bacterium]
MKLPDLIAGGTRPATTLLLSAFVGLAAMTGIAEARSCGTMKTGPYAGMPMPAMPYPMYKGMHAGPGYRPGMQAAPSVVSVAKRAGEFGTLLTAVEAAGLTALLEGNGPFTLFAPTDAAFKNLPEGALQELLADKAKLTAILRYHVVPGRVTAAEILSSQTLKTASGQDLPTGDLGVVRADIPAGNGIIHVVEKVLLPSG